MHCDLENVQGRRLQSVLPKIGQTTSQDCISGMNRRNYCPNSLRIKELQNVPAVAHHPLYLYNQRPFSYASKQGKTVFIIFHLTYSEGSTR